jgi:hydrogenase maturation protease
MILEFRFSCFDSDSDPSPGHIFMTRILCLGNELLADDAFGLVAAEELRRRFPQMDVVFSTDSGFHLLDNLLEAKFIVVVDCIQTNSVPPGTLFVLRSSDLKSIYGPSPHYVGLLETLQLARELLLNVPKDVIILAVEAADCLTLGGKMHDAVKSTVGLVVELVAEIVNNWKPVDAQQEVSTDGLRRAIDTVSARWGSERLVVI